MKNLRIVTVATHRPFQWYYTFDQFFASSRKHGFEPLVLDGKFHHYSGLGSKVKMVYKAIKDGLIPEKHILFCDCFDMFFADSPNELLRKWFEFKDSPVVFSAEKNCLPADLKEQYDEFKYKSSYCYLNSGMIVGETEKFLQLLESMNPTEIPDDYRNPDGSMTHINDQFLYQQAFLNSPVNVALDNMQTLCQTLHEVNIDELDLSGEKIKNKETGECPILYHANGSAKDSGVKEPILKYLNLL